MPPVRSRLSSKKAQPDICLYMECEDEELSPAQKSLYTKHKSNSLSFNKKLDDYLKRMKGKLILDEGDYFSFEVKHTIEVPTPPPRPAPPVPPTYPSQANTYLVVLPQTQQQATVQASPQPGKSPVGRPTRQASVPIAPAPTLTYIKPAARTRSGAKVAESPESGPAPPVTRGTRTSRSVLSTQAPPPSVTPFVTPTPPVYTPEPPKVAQYVVRKGVTPLRPTLKPTESTAIGGLLVGTKGAKDALLTKINETELDSKEVTVGKVTSIPSLLIVARPHMVPKSSVANAQLERANLDVQVKGVLMFTPSKFTEWLLQQGLIQSNRDCPTHVTAVRQKAVPLKLGMYSDVAKFPWSGGYVWIADCCPDVYISVFQGSIFEGAPHPPAVILKLLYHWACQTNVQNVLQWVKVEPAYMRNVYSILRAVCCLAVNKKYGKIGGPKCKVEVGVISLGTVPSDGEGRRLKFEVVGVMDPENNLLRLRAIPPSNPQEKQGKRRYARILEPLSDCVDKLSVILTDNTVDKDTLNMLGFRNVQQSVTTDQKPLNENVMGYLRRIVPKVFQNTLHHLSIELIQQFLDELVWRERWGPIAATAFSSMIADIAFLMGENQKDGLLKVLIGVVENPFGVKAATTDEHVEITEVVVPSPPRTRKQKLKVEDDADLTPAPPAKKPCKEKDKAEEVVGPGHWIEQPSQTLSIEIEAFLMKKETNEVVLENYYYGVLVGDDSYLVDKKPSQDIKMKCSICLKSFKDNLSLMKHILLHCQTKPKLTNFRKVFQCDLCFIGFKTEKAMKAHSSDVHSPPANKINLICQICQKLFPSETQLKYHMHQMHVAAELPYACGVCHMRSSSYDTIVRHFTLYHHSGYHVICPYCLASVNLVHKNTVVETNIMFFIKHVLRHHRQTDETQCNRCKLSFVNKLVLHRHQLIDHASFSFQPDVKPLPLESTTMMPTPGNIIKAAHNISVEKPTRLPGPYSVQESFESLKFEAEMYLTCSECEGTLASPEHFAGWMSCSKCSYKTCCYQAMTEHQTLAHIRSIPSPPIYPALDGPMYCPCGFYSYCGQRMANHLVQCGRETAYGNEQSARAEISEFRKGGARKSLRSKQNEEPTVLNMLGLVRTQATFEEQDQIAENLSRLFQGTPPKETPKTVEVQRGKRAASTATTLTEKGRKQKKVKANKAELVPGDAESNATTGHVTPKSKRTKNIRKLVDVSTTELKSAEITGKVLFDAAELVGSSQEETTVGDSATSVVPMISEVTSDLMITDKTGTVSKMESEPNKFQEVITVAQGEVELMEVDTSASAEDTAIIDESPMDMSPYVEGENLSVITMQKRDEAVIESMTEARDGHLSTENTCEIGEPSDGSGEATSTSDKNIKEHSSNETEIDPAHIKEPCIYTTAHESEVEDRDLLKNSEPSRLEEKRNATKCGSKDNYDEGKEDLVEKSPATLIFTELAADSNSTGLAKPINEPRIITVIEELPEETTEQFGDSPVEKDSIHEKESASSVADNGDNGGNTTTVCDEELVGVGETEKIAQGEAKKSEEMFATVDDATSHDLLRDDKAKGESFVDSFNEFQDTLVDDTPQKSSFDEDMKVEKPLGGSESTDALLKQNTERPSVETVAIEVESEVGILEGETQIEGAVNFQSSLIQSSKPQETMDLEELDDEEPVGELLDNIGNGTTLCDGFVETEKIVEEKSYSEAKCYGLKLGEAKENEGALPTDADAISTDLFHDDKAEDEQISDSCKELQETLDDVTAQNSSLDLEKPFQSSESTDALMKENLERHSVEKNDIEEEPAGVGISRGESQVEGIVSLQSCSIETRKQQYTVDPEEELDTYEPVGELLDSTTGCHTDLSSKRAQDEVKETTESDKRTEKVFDGIENSATVDSEDFEQLTLESKQSENEVDECILDNRETIFANEESDSVANEKLLVDSDLEATSQKGVEVDEGTPIAAGHVDLLDYSVIDDTPTMMATDAQTHCEEELLTQAINQINEPNRDDLVGEIPRDSGLSSSDSMSIRGEGTLGSNVLRARKSSDVDGLVVPEDSTSIQHVSDEAMDDISVETSETGRENEEKCAEIAGVETVRESIEKMRETIKSPADMQEESERETTSTDTGDAKNASTEVSANETEILKEPMEEIADPTPSDDLQIMEGEEPRQNVTSGNQ